MSALYEVQVFQDQSWKVDSVFDDQDLAIEAARRISGGGRRAARVIEEQTDSKTGRAVMRAVFRISKGSPAGKLESGPVDQAPAVGDIEQRVRSYVSDKRRRKGPFLNLAVVLRLLMGAVLVGAGFVAIYFVHDYLNKLMP